MVSCVRSLTSVTRSISTATEPLQSQFSGSSEVVKILLQGFECAGAREMLHNGRHVAKTRGLGVRTDVSRNPSSS
jgi:hypothetical protein